MPAKIVIDTKKSEISFFVDTRIYNYKSILKSKDEFKQICNTEIKSPLKEIPFANPKHFFTIVMRPKIKLKEGDMEKLVYEFFNHMLNWEKILRTSD